MGNAAIDLSSRALAAAGPPAPFGAVLLVLKPFKGRVCHRRSAALRSETVFSRRPGAVKPQFHQVPAGTAAGNAASLISQQPQ